MGAKPVGLQQISTGCDFTHQAGEAKTPKPTTAKADIWANWDDFQGKARDFEREAKALAAVAKGNDEAKDKEQFKKVAETCKSCHEKYKKKD